MTPEAIKANLRSEGSYLVDDVNEELYIACSQCRKLEKEGTAVYDRGSEQYFCSQDCLDEYEEECEACAEPPFEPYYPNLKTWI